MNLTKIVLFTIVLLGNLNYEVYSGYLSAYSQTPTDATIEYRINNDDIPSVEEYDGVIAVLDCSLIGNDALLIVEGKIFHLLVFDCAGIADGGYEWMVENNISGEIGWYLWQQEPDIVHKESIVIVER